MSESELPTMIAPVEKPVQFDEPQLPFLVQVDDFLWVSRARAAFGIDGGGLAAAVLDTGINAAHVDFAGRVIAQRNYTSDNGGNPDDATDGQGHGTNVAGIIAANGDHLGMAPGANLVALKVLGNTGGGSFQGIDAALGWVVENHGTFRITAVCMSLGDGSNFTDDTPFLTSPVHAAMRDKIRTLRSRRVAVVIAAGNDYFKHGSKQGMSFPAILRECVSVGALYDADEGSFAYGSGAKANSTRAGQITPFSQRLHPSASRACYTDIFAPGAPVTSTGIRGEHGESTQHGTSQATPVVCGIILLLQDFYFRATGELPTVEDLILWMRRGGEGIIDGDDEDDNVTHTNLRFVRIDALSALDAARRALRKRQVQPQG